MPPFRLFIHPAGPHGNMAVKAGENRNERSAAAFREGNIKGIFDHCAVQPGIRVSPSAVDQIQHGIFLFPGIAEGKIHIRVFGNLRPFFIPRCIAQPFDASSPVHIVILMQLHASGPPFSLPSQICQRSADDRGPHRRSSLICMVGMPSRQTFARQLYHSLSRTSIAGDNRLSVPEEQIRRSRAGALIVKPKPPCRFPFFQTPMLDETGCRV